MGLNDDGVPALTPDQLASKNVAPKEESPWEQSPIGKVLASASGEQQSPQDAADAAINRIFPMQQENAQKEKAAVLAEANKPENFVPKFDDKDLQNREAYNNRGVPDMPPKKSSDYSDAEYNKDLADNGYGSNRSPASKAISQMVSGNKSEAPAAAPAANPLEDTEMKNAMEQARSNRERANYMSSMSDLSSAIIGSGGADMSKNRITSVDRDLATADQPLQDLNLQRDEYKKFLQNKDDREKNDPNSAVSKAMRDVLGKSGVKLPETATYATMEKLAPQIMHHEEMQQKIKDRALQYAQLNATKQLALSSKASDKQIAAAGKTQQMLEQMRGNPAVQQAEKDIYAASKVNSMVNLKSDPNQLDNQQVQLLASEVGKIATGGVPTTHELQGLNVSTLPSKLAGITQTFLNKPSPANKAAFVKSMQEYVNSLTVDARKVVTDRYGRILESNKAHISPDDYNTLKSQYMGRFDQAENNTSSKGSVSPQTLQDYAKKHNIDTNAAADLLTKAGYNVQK
jgi:hypothetical protein